MFAESAGMINVLGLMAIRLGYVWSDIIWNVIRNKYICTIIKKRINHFFSYFLFLVNLYTSLFGKEVYCLWKWMKNVKEVYFLIFVGKYM